MKARVKATGNIVDVEWYGHNSMGTIYADVTHTAKYYEYELDFDTVYDYWTRLEHQYAGMAMNALLLTNNIRNGDLEGMRECNTNAMAIAYALVEKYKKEEK